MRLNFTFLTRQVIAGRNWFHPEAIKFNSRITNVYKNNIYQTLNYPSPKFVRNFASSKTSSNSSNPRWFENIKALIRNNRLLFTGGTFFVVGSSITIFDKMYISKKGDQTNNTINKDKISVQGNSNATTINKASNITQTINVNHSPNDLSSPLPKEKKK